MRPTMKLRTPAVSALAAVALAAAFALGTPSGVQAQQGSLREIPKDAKPGVLTHVAENIFTLDGNRVRLAPGGTIRGANNLIMTPNMLPRESLVRYQTDRDGNLAKAWVLSRDEAAKAGSGSRYPWQTSPETGTPINQVLPAQAQPGAPAQPQQQR